MGLTAALGLEEDGDRSGSKLASKLVEFYQKRGYHDVEVKLETRGDDGGDEVVVVPLPGADHGFATPARADFRPADLRALVVASAVALVTGVVGRG